MNEELIEATLDLLARVADYWSGTDAPIGEDAKSLILQWNRATF